MASVLTDGMFTIIAVLRNSRWPAIVIATRLCRRRYWNYVTLR
jgi:hypothetical protein